MLFSPLAPCAAGAARLFAPPLGGARAEGVPCISVLTQRVDFLNIDSNTNLQCKKLPHASWESNPECLKYTLALMPTHARCSLRMLPICGAAPRLSCEGRAIYTYSRGRRSASPRLPAPHLMSPRPPPTARDDLGLRPPHWRAGRRPCLEGAVAAQRCPIDDAKNLTAGRKGAMPARPPRHRYPAVPRGGRRRACRGL